MLGHTSCGPASFWQSAMRLQFKRRGSDGGGMPRVSDNPWRHTLQHTSQSPDSSGPEHNPESRLPPAHCMHHRSPVMSQDACAYLENAEVHSACFSELCCLLLMVMALAVQSVTVLRHLGTPSRADQHTSLSQGPTCFHLIMPYASSFRMSTVRSMPMLTAVASSCVCAQRSCMQHCRPYMQLRNQGFQGLSLACACPWVEWNAAQSSHTPEYGFWWGDLKKVLGAPESSWESRHPPQPPWPPCPASPAWLPSPTAGLQRSTRLLQPGKKHSAGWDGVPPCKPQAVHDPSPLGCSPCCKRMTPGLHGGEWGVPTTCWPRHLQPVWSTLDFCMQEACSRRAAGAPTCAHGGERVVQQQRVGLVRLVLPRKPHLHARRSMHEPSLHGRVVFCMLSSVCLPAHALQHCRSKCATQNGMWLVMMHSGIAQPRTL